MKQCHLQENKWTRNHHVMQNKPISGRRYHFYYVESGSGGRKVKGRLLERRKDLEDGRKKEQDK